jgi:hypothetical protein
MKHEHKTAQPAPLGQVERGVGRPVPERATGGLRGFGVTITPGGARCWCRACNRDTKGPGGWPYLATTFVVCPDCGNKRCPKATDHLNACTDSNEAAQRQAPLLPPEKAPEPVQEGLL